MRKQGYIRYAKTLFKPTRPEEVDEILRKYSNQKVPNFFYYAKNKMSSQVAPANDSVINKIMLEIKDNRNSFRHFRKIADIDYTLLLKNKEDNYYNEELNIVFDRWNRTYGNFARYDEDYREKNNLMIIAKQIRKDLNAIEEDDDKIINYLAVMLYKKPSIKKKKLFWLVYGEQLYKNLQENVENIPICVRCGTRTDERLIRGKCFNCRKEEIQKLGGYKLIKCCDCGREMKLESKSRTVRCDECRDARRKKQISDNALKYYHNNKGKLIHSKENKDIQKS